MINLELPGPRRRSRRPSATFVIVKRATTAGTSSPTTTRIEAENSQNPQRSALRAGTCEKADQSTHDGTRTRNLRLRRATPCPLGHESFVYVHWSAPRVEAPRVEPGQVLGQEKCRGGALACETDPARTGVPSLHVKLSWPNGQGVALLRRRLRVRVPSGVFLRGLSRHDSTQFNTTR